jgi:hypothetical protein
MSKLKIIWKFLFGGREAVLDYLLDTANSLVAKIGDAKQSEVKGYLAQAETILATLNRYSWLCPQKWLNAYGLTLTAFADVVQALSDLKLTPEEVTSICAAFQTAYAAWRAD